MRVFELTACPGCASSAASEELLGNFPLRRCEHCSLVYAPEYGDPEEIYTEGYLKGDSEFGLDLFHPLFQEFLDHAADRRLDIVEKYNGGTGSMLDVGCGSGEVLRRAAGRGWMVVGCEPVQESAEIARGRGLDVRSELLQESGFPEATYDVVSAFHVLEHMSDGLEFLRTMARWARPGGLVVVEVPNYEGLERRRKGGAWPGLRRLEHLGHYGPSTLHATMQRAGLEPVRVRTLGFLWRRQTLAQSLADLGLVGWERRFERLRLTHAGVQNGEEASMPRRPAWQLLLAIQAAYDLARRGQVVLGIARVPERSAEVTASA